MHAQRTHRVATGILAVLHLALLLPGLAAEAQTSGAAGLEQRELAVRLMSEDASDRRLAFYESLTIPPEEVGAELAVSLVHLLQAMNAVVSEAVVRGVPLSTVHDPSFIAALSRRVAELGDPSSIPALAQAIYGGLAVSEALVRFGRPVVPAVLEVVQGRQNHHDLVDHGLRTLTLLLEENERSGLLSNSDLAAVVDAVESRLIQPGYFTTLWAAIDLAGRLGEPRLLGLVQVIADDDEAVRMRGITASEIISLTRARAVAVLQRR